MAFRKITCVHQYRPDSEGAQSMQCMVCHSGSYYNNMSRCQFSLDLLDNGLPFRTASAQKVPQFLGKRPCSTVLSATFDGRTRTMFPKMARYDYPELIPASGSTSLSQACGEYTAFIAIQSRHRRDEKLMRCWRASRGCKPRQTKSQICASLGPTVTARQRMPFH